MQPIRWLVEILGPCDSDTNEDDEDNYNQASRNYTTSGNSSGRNSIQCNNRKDGQCMHEDGGRFAVFESTELDPVRVHDLASLAHICCSLSLQISSCVVICYHNYMLIFVTDRMRYHTADKCIKC